MKEHTKSIIFRILFLFAVYLGSGVRCYAQAPDLKFEHLTTEDGLSQNTVTGIVKDKYGFMWFGTWSGLCRYDGYHFRVYRYQQGKPSSLINNRILNVGLDDKKDLWIVTFNDTVLCRYRYETDDFERVPTNNVAEALKRKINRNIHLKNVAVNYNGYRWDLDWAKKDLLQTNLSTKKQVRYSTNPVNHWTINDSFATDLYLDDQHILWVGTYSNGINRANLAAKPFRYGYHDPKNRNSIIDNNVRTIAEDLEGNLWIGTRDKGISIISKQGSYKHLQETGDASGLGSGYIKTIFCDSRGYVWIGTRKGLDGFNPKTGQLKRFITSTNRSVQVFSVLEDHLGQIWFATWDGIYTYFPKLDTIVRQEVRGLPNRFAMTIIEDRSHQIWIGTEGGGIGVFKPQAGQKLKLVQTFKHQSKPDQLISDDRVYSLFEDSEKQIWIGTASGLDRFDPRKRSFKHFAASPNGLLSDNVTGIVEDGKKSIWASHTKGISKINMHSFAIRNFSQQDGLQSNDFSDGTIFKSPITGMMYLGGNYGYNIFHPDSIKIDRSLPKVVLTQLQVLNRPVEVNDTINGRILLQKPLYLTDKIELNYLDKSIAIDFASLHFANPSASKYAYKLVGFDKNWIYTDALNRTAVYSNLAKGHYTFKVKASNSDGIWNNNPTTLAIIVFPPWWASNLAYAGYFMVCALLLFAFYYHTLRVERLKNKLAYENLLHEKEIELHQSKINFFTNISHEIKTPLSLILAPLERMMTFKDASVLMKEQLQTMRHSGDRLLRLINQLLDIRRFETGNDQLKLKDGDLIGFLQQIITSFRDLSVEKEISLVLNTSVSSLYCSFDYDKIEKVLYNMLSNAIKFTPNGGNVEVRLVVEDREEKSWIHIEVLDNGLLINEEDFDLIFQPFQQAGAHEKGGTGLGLAYSKALAELHGGSIAVRSNSDEDGSVLTAFTLSLPLIVGSSTILSQTENALDLDISPNYLPKSTSKAVKESASFILIVEDDLSLRNYLTGFFSDDYEIFEAENGLDGLQIAREKVPDLIITDMTMPKMDGLELCNHLKTDVATSHIPVILLTARSAIEFQLKGAENGADDYITKPFNLELLSVKVKNLLRLRQLLQEKYKGKMTIQPSEIIPVSPDEKLLKKVLLFVEEKIADPDLDVLEICKAISLSRTQLYRKMKALTGLTIVEIIRDIRIERAKQLLISKKFNVNEVCYMVGMNDVNYFRRVFKESVGQSPSEYVKQQGF